MPKSTPILLATLFALTPRLAQAIEPVLREVLAPDDRPSFQADCPLRKPSAVAANPHLQGGILVFHGISGDRQSDPQIAVGPEHVFLATNSGNYLFDKSGVFQSGTDINCFSGPGFPIDPKTFYDPVAKRFGMSRMDITSVPWVARLAVSKSADPTQGFWQYNVKVTDGVDGGAIGFSGSWLVYLYPSNAGKRVIALDGTKVVKGETAAVFRFEEGDFDFGQPAFTHDSDVQDQYFLGTAGDRFTVSRIHGSLDAPSFELVTETPHQGYYDFPPGAPQKGTSNRAASGDSTTKIAVLRNQSLWFASEFASTLGQRHAAIHWGQIGLTGDVKQLGSIDDPSGKVFYMQPTIGVNKQNDVLVGYQVSSADSYVSARYAYRLAGDAPNSLRPAIALEEGSDAADDGAWGDYSGTSIDGGNELDIWTQQSFAEDTGGRIHQTVVARHVFEGPASVGGAGGASGSGGVSGGSSGNGPLAGANSAGGSGGAPAAGGTGGGGLPAAGGSMAVAGSSSGGPGVPALGGTDSGCGCRLGNSHGLSIAWGFGLLLLLRTARKRRAS